MSATRICIVDSCGRKHHALGYCKAHYGRWREYGDPLAGGAYKTVLRGLTPLERIAYRTEPNDAGCLVWRGAVATTGRPMLNVAGKMVRPYRLIMEQVAGPLTLDQTVDHVCRNPLCCNPEHLQILTPIQNSALERVRNGRTTGWELLWLGLQGIRVSLNNVMAVASEPNPHLGDGAVPMAGVLEAIA